MSYKKEALDYHEKGRAGKIEVISTKPCHSQKDLSLAYTPGVAVPCRKIEAAVLLALERQHYVAGPVFWGRSS